MDVESVFRQEALPEEALGRVSAGKSKKRQEDIPLYQRPQRSEDGWGPEEKRVFLVARKRIPEGAWELYSEGRSTARHPGDHAIEAAEAEYDAGRAEMAQGRDGMWTLQYLFPRKVVDGHRLGWFRPAPSKVPAVIEPRTRARRAE